MHKIQNINVRLFLSFLKIGMFTFGGGYAMVPLIEKEVIYNRRWVDKERFLELLVLAQSAPGPISLNTAVFVGFRLNRYLGAVSALMGIIVPCFFIILLIAVYFADIKDNPVVESIFKGMRPAVVALIIAPILGLGRGMGAYRILLAVAAALAVWRVGLSPVWLIVAGAAGGMLWVYFSNRARRRRVRYGKLDGGPKTDDGMPDIPVGPGAGCIDHTAAERAVCDRSMGSSRRERTDPANKDAVPNSDLTARPREVCADRLRSDRRGDRNGRSGKIDGTYRCGGRGWDMHNSDSREDGNAVADRPRTDPGCIQEDAVADKPRTTDQGNEQACAAAGKERGSE